MTSNVDAAAAPVGGCRLVTRRHRRAGDSARRRVMAMVAPQAGPELGLLTEQLMDAFLLANGVTAGSA